MESNVSANREANRLYWQTDRSVADIATGLGVSRRALYELIEPEKTGVRCGACGAFVVFVNRSAKAASLARCPECNVETEVDDVSESQDNIPPYAAGWPRAAEGEPTELPGRTLRIGGAAAAGAAIGALAALLILRRR